MGTVSRFRLEDDAGEAKRASLGIKFVPDKRYLGRWLQLREVLRVHATTLCAPESQNAEQQLQS
jgi:hypothetical protein